MINDEASARLSEIRKIVGFTARELQDLSTGLVPGLPLTDRSEIARYANAFTDLSALAVRDAQARRLVIEAIKALD